MLGSEQLFVDEPTQPPPGLAELDSEEERNTILRWIRDQALGNCQLVYNWLNSCSNSLFLPMVLHAKVHRMPARQDYQK